MGNTVSHISDIDFLIITENELPDDQRNRILGLSEGLQKGYPFVWSVDLTVMEYERFPYLIRVDGKIAGFALDKGIHSFSIGETDFVCCRES